MNRSAQRGVALVITLIMLSVVTFMAIAFLALSRRERGSVSVTVDQTTATLMADAALARAKTEIVGRLASFSNAASYELIVSTNYYNTNGFATSAKGWDFTPENVNYFYLRGNRKPLVTEADWIQNIANLYMDPRPPVLVNTNYTELTPNKPPPLDFRFYWDFNRNGMYDTNGWQVYGDINGRLYTNYFVGDPEWIGILEKPNQPHSRYNKFIGRYAYIVLPAGKSLDINFMHNQAKRLSINGDGYYRDQGVGAWELNLAAFLRELNTNIWAYQYNTNLSTASPRSAFFDANSILQYRYGGSYNNLSNVLSLLGPAAANAFTNNFVDDYTQRYPGLTNELDKAQFPWPGSDNPQTFADVQELLDARKVTNSFVSRLMTPGYSTNFYDRYTFYRMLSQLGVDSSPTLSNRINLNSANVLPGGLTDFREWTPIQFFTNAADRILRNQFGPMGLNISLTNIPIYPTNYYSSAVHRCLQLAANIYDATTNRSITAAPQAPYLPSVFRPLFNTVSNMVFISGFVEETNAAFVSYPWLDLNIPAHRQTNNWTRVNVHGIPVVVGAKKGLPNFNEFSMQNAVQISRRLEIRKDQRSLRPNQTNQLYMVGISNTFGVELWNSYTQAYPRPLLIRGKVEFSIALTNQGNSTPLQIYNNSFAIASATNSIIPANTWTGNRYMVPLNTNVIFMTNAVYVSLPSPHFVQYAGTNYVFDPGLGFPIPQWGLAITSRLQYILVDMPSARVVDFVNVRELVSRVDLTRELMGNMNFGETSGAGAFWQTNRLTTNGVTQGIREQILTSLGQGTNNNSSLWVEYNQDAVAGRTKEKAVDLFRAFVGINPLHYPMAQMQQELGNTLARQAPFTPIRKIYQNISWQVNDPLIHYTWEDLYDMERTNNVQYAVPPQAMPTNSNLGQLNRKYRPWGGNPNISSDTNAFNLSLKDPEVRRSDDWHFPTNKFPNIGWLGRVHRGTPWQTIYLKSTVVPQRTWGLWAANLITHPTNDWRLLELFTTAPNANAASGLLSVNQTNMAAWSAVLSGLVVQTNINRLTLNNMVIEPATNQLKQIVTDIIQTKATRRNQVFNYMGEILATPSLTVNSPFLNPQYPNVSDEVYEQIPQKILSLLKADEPRIVVYAYGQALAPSGRPVPVPGYSDLNYQVYTNYHIVSEVLTKHVLRIEGAPTNPVVVPERFQTMMGE